MTIIKLYPQDITNLMKNTNNIINIDTDGIIIKYNEDTLIKLYYKNFFNALLNPTPKTLITELDTKKKIEAFLTKNKGIKPLLKEIQEKIIALNKTEEQGLIKGIITCTNYPVGILLTNYKDYEPLNNIKDTLTKKELQIVLTTVKYLINNLTENNIYPETINEKNIIVRKKDLDVKLINLDTKDTRIETETYINKFPHIPRNVEKNYQEMKKRILKK